MPDRREVAPDARVRAHRVRLLITDVDGVLTDGRLYFGPQGEALKVFDVRDGHGIKLLLAAGITVAILSARRSEIVDRRASDLGIQHVLQGESNKAEGYARLCATCGVSAEQCAFIGDDWPDLPVLQRVGFAATVADAAAEVKAVAHWIAGAPGGRAAVRELAEYVLRAQGKFDAQLAAQRGDSHA
jgi:3-deoxy-D-manno-octulosonate 8-phosphate phosphatase (KDO 8-P phosphatase)